jgi:hypothetical protein
MSPSAARIGEGWADGNDANIARLRGRHPEHLLAHGPNPLRSWPGQLFHKGWERPYDLTDAWTVNDRFSREADDWSRR